MSDLFFALNRNENDITKDFILLADDGTEFKVHKDFIYKKWPTLKQLNENCIMNECDKNDVFERLQTEIRADLLNLLIDYFYNIDLNINKHSFTIIEQLLETAHKFSITDCIEKVIELLSEKINYDNCLTLWKLCKRYHFKNSFKVVVHIGESLDLLYDWYRLNVNDIALILNDSYLNVRNESDVWAMIVLWINIDRLQRAQHAQRLSRLLRYSAKYDAMVFFSSDKSGLLPNDFLDQIDFCNVQSRVPRDVIVIFGGSNREARQLNINDVEVFDKRINEWNKCRVLAGIHNTSNALVIVDKEIFSLGGRGSRCMVNILEPPPPNAASVWHERAPMYANRTHAAACVSNGKIYIMGGYANDDILSSVEKYDPKTNQWRKMPSMLSGRSSAAAVWLNGKIYAIGGTDGRTLLNSVEIFDEETETWAEGPPLLTARKAHSAVVWDGGILVAGGLCTIPFFNIDDDLMAQNSVEFFNPKTNRWLIKAQMDYARFNFSMVVFYDEVYAIGGQANFESPLNSVEKFDGKQWRVNSFLKDPRGYHKACVLHYWPRTEALLGDKLKSRNEYIDLNDEIAMPSL